MPINELTTNAIKHGRTEDEGNIVIRVRMRIETATFSLWIESPGELPAGFDFSSGDRLETGLGLVNSLMPSEGSSLAFSADNGWVKLELTLNPPVLIVSDQPQTAVLAVYRRIAFLPKLVPV